MQALRRNRLTTAVNLSLLLLPGLAAAQTAPTDAAAQAKTLDRVEVTGSRIKQTDKVTSQPVAIITRAQIDQSGVTSIGDFLQQLTASGKALNAKFNSSGNFGYPASGGGIGAGSAQVDLRNLGSQRVLVLVDGIRWVNESSASGVSGSSDLNTIPLAIVDRIEVLEDGASAIYGSDAIAGVINIITRKKFDGALIHTSRYHGRRRRRQVPRRIQRQLCRIQGNQFGCVGGLAVSCAGCRFGRGQFGHPTRALHILRSAYRIVRRSEQPCAGQLRGWRLFQHDTQQRHNNTELQQRRPPKYSGYLPSLHVRGSLQLCAVQPFAHAVQAQVAFRQFHLQHQ
jgi:hypothetical protein